VIVVTADFDIVDVAPFFVTMVLNTKNRHFRPGGTVSGPSMFALADVSVYFFAFWHILLIRLQQTFYTDHKKRLVSDETEKPA